MMKLRSRCLGIAAALFVTGTAGLALAENLHSIVYEGMNGADDDSKDEDNTTNDGSGNEQGIANYVQVGTDYYANMVWMNSNTGGDGGGNYDCWYASWKLAPGLEPEMVAKVQLTDYETGERQCNHPHLETVYVNGTALQVFTYGSDYNNASPQSFAHMIALDGTFVSNKLKYSNNNNDNEGATFAQTLRAGRTMGNLDTSAIIYALYGNNNASSFARTLLLEATPGGEMMYNLSNIDLQATITPTNIPRPQAALNDAGDYALHCDARGNNRPPEMGVQCAMVQIDESGQQTIMWKEYIRQSGGGYYSNQSSVYALGNDEYAVNLISSDGGGDKNADAKGQTEGHLYVVKADPDGMQQIAHIKGMGAYSSHQGMCAGKYGTDGKWGIAVVDAPITGIGLTLMDVAVYDQSAKFLEFDKGMDRWVVSPYDGDSGYYQNIYGGNPHTQGRGFPNCGGTVPNPSHGMAVGFMPHVKSFFMVPHVAGVSLEDKLSIFMAFIPAEVDAAMTPGDPTEGEKPIEYPEEDVNNANNNPPGTNPPGTVGGPGLENATAGGCNVATTGDNDLNGFGLVLGLGFLGLALRRREEV
jgi:MYXO-CTERM domain-containing protein